MQSRLRIMLACSLGGLPACSGSAVSQDGTISLSITDAPIDAARSIMVRFTGPASAHDAAAGPGVGRVLPKVYLFSSAGLQPAAIRAAQPKRRGPIDFILPAP